MIAQAHDKWLEDISRYEETLGEMANASLDQNFKEELGAIEQWFRVLSEAERTSALYSLLQQATQVQIRFLIMVLQQMARSDPLAAILSPANFNKDAMTEKMASAMGQLSMKPSPSPSFLRPTASGKALDSTTISQMFPDAAAALANQRLELNRMKTGQTATTLAPPSKDEGVRTPWTPSFRKTFDPPTRPRSAEPSNSGLRASVSAGTPLKSPRTTDLNPMSGPYSPFIETGGNWASMTNTPATAMFPRSSLSMDSLQQRLAASEVPRSGSSNLGQPSPRIVLESDVRKFRKPLRSPNVETNRAVSSPLMMYDDNGQLMSVRQTQQYSSPIINRAQAMPLPATPAGGAWQIVTPNSLGSSYRLASSSPVLTMGGDGYHSDNSQGRKKSTPTKAENPADPRLLNDVSAWLRQLRLHKYNDNLKSMKWQEMIKLNDSDLEKKGISALGARRKLLKAFETVQAAIDEGVLEGI